MPSRASFWGAMPPELASFMVPVRGALAPTEIRPEVGALVPVTIPVEKVSLLAGPRG